MKKTKKILMLAVMLLASVNMMGQRAAMTFSGKITGFPGMGGSDVTLTIKPTGEFLFDVKGNDRVSAFTFSGIYPPQAFYDMPGTDGKQGVQSTSFVWALPLTGLTAFDVKDKTATVKYQPSANGVKGNVTGKTTDKAFQLKVVLFVVTSNGQIQLPLECKLGKN